MRWRVGTVLTLFAVLTALIGGAGLGAGAQESGSAEDAFAFQGEGTGSLDLDARGGRVAPTAAQRSDAAALDAIVRWNQLGTPASLLPSDAALAVSASQNAVVATRDFVADNADLFRLSPDAAGDLELLYDVRIGRGHAVMMRQRFGDLPAGQDGLIATAVVDGDVVYVSSTLAPPAEPSAVVLSPVDAVLAAAADVGLGVGSGDIGDVETRDGVTVVQVEGLTNPAIVELVAVPLPGGEVRSAHQVTLINNVADTLGVRSLIDAATGEVLVREDLVDRVDPSWEVFPASPLLDYSSSDTREVWCWVSAPGCDRVVGNDASPLAWDVDPTTGLPTNTTNGNNAIAVHNWLSNNPFTVGTETATARPARDYLYGWTNQWFEERCNPDTTFTTSDRNDIDAARANLFVMHNRMHDWSYNLGFTEATFNMQRDNFGLGGLGNDPERGNAQAGGVSGGPASGFAARDNANQITGADGIAPITNMYLWQPIPGGFYAPCVDGDFDMTVIGHEYTHATSNRMVAGPNTGLSGDMAGAMGESWSDLNAMEILNEYGIVPVAGENPYAIGPYVTGDPQAGIRNYGMNQSPLNFSDVGYDFVCNVATCPRLSQVHADGEIWSATNFAIREAFNTRYDGAFPSGNAALQTSCAEGLTPVNECPGNRRWIQLVYDAWLLMAVGNVSMLDARNAMLAADQLRFGGANQDLLWNVFASRGFGEDAIQNGTNDVDPVPSFVSPFADEATLQFIPHDGEGNPLLNAKLFVGRYEARVTPAADTDPGTPLANEVQLVPGTYDVVVQAPGYGLKRDTLTLHAGQVREFTASPLFPNLASSANGATATGEGVNLAGLIDDTEATNWAFLGAAGVGVAGRQVTVRLDPSRPFHTIGRVQVSAMLRHRIPADPNDPLAQGRFTALRSFEIYTCEVKGGVDCTQDDDFTLIFESPPDAFPSIGPRPRAPDLIVQEFDVPNTKATYVRLVVLTNQCTGAPAYAGDQDDDPLNVTDCQAGSTSDDIVRAAELQVFRN